jgi:hypothetical protein
MQKGGVGQMAKRRQKEGENIASHSPKTAIMNSLIVKAGQEVHDTPEAFLADPKLRLGIVPLSVRLGLGRVVSRLARAAARGGGG